MSICSKLLLLLLVIVGTSACSKTEKVHELTNLSFALPFKFEGYAVDNGENNWIYFLHGEVGGITIRHDAPLMISGQIFGCPPQMEVVAQDNKVQYTLAGDLEAEYSRQVSDACVTHYANIFSDLVREKTKNINSY